MTDSFETKLFDILKTKKPLLQDSSIKLYIRNMRTIAKGLNIPFDNIDFLNNKNKVDEVLEGKSNNTIKTYYASIIVVLNSTTADPKLIAKYKTDMDILQDQYKSQVESQQKTEKQEENWISYNDLLNTMDILKKHVKPMLKSFDIDPSLGYQQINKKDFNQIQEWVVASLYLLEPEKNPPVRLEYSNMKILNNKQWSSIADVEDDKLNYLVVKNNNKKFFVFNNYKTAKVYHQKIIDVGSELNKVLNKWLKINTSDYLLLNSKNEPFSKNGLTKFIQKIFGSSGKKVSVSMIRHAYLSSRYNADTQDKASIAESMMHSVSMQSGYIKK